MCKTCKGKGTVERIQPKFTAFGGSGIPRLGERVTETVTCTKCQGRGRR